MPKAPYVKPHVITQDDLKHGLDGQVAHIYDDAFAYRILAEGDSWFSIGAIPSSNLLFELGFDDASIVLNLAYPGDTVETMSGIAGNPDLKKMLYDEQWGYRWDLIALSGGGNDVIDGAAEFIRAPANKKSKKAADWVDQQHLGELIAGVQGCYRKVVEVRDEPGSINAGKPIVIHTYDYFTPRNAPAKFIFAGLLGPWLHPVFDALETPDAVRVSVGRHVVDALAEGLLALSKGPDKLSNFHVVDTRGLLEPAGTGDIGNSEDWLNEIHPNHQGYRKMARKISATIATLL